MFLDCEQNRAFWTWQDHCPHELIATMATCTAQDLYKIKAVNIWAWSGRGSQTSRSSWEAVDSSRLLVWGELGF